MGYIHRSSSRSRSRSGSVSPEYEKRMQERVIKRREEQKKYYEQLKADFPFIIDALERLNHTDLLYHIYAYFLKITGIPLKSQEWIDIIKEGTPYEIAGRCQMGSRNIQTQKKILKYCVSKKILPKDWLKKPLLSEKELNKTRARGILGSYENILKNSDEGQESRLLATLMNIILERSWDEKKTKYFPDPKRNLKSFMNMLNSLTFDEADVMCLYLPFASEACKRNRKPNKNKKVNLFYHSSFNRS